MGQPDDPACPFHETSAQDFVAVHKENAQARAPPRAPVAILRLNAPVKNHDKMTIKKRRHGSQCNTGGISEWRASIRAARP
jgi:hypothetical protein